MKFDLRQALRNLDIEVKPFGYTGEGETPLCEEAKATVRGYSCDRWLTINPNERWPVFVTFHEMAHILLGHTKRHQHRPDDLKEAECHVTAIYAAQLTDTPFDFNAETDHLRYMYTRGRQIPDEVMERAMYIAKKIAAAGKVDARSLNRRVAA